MKRIFVILLALSLSIGFGVGVLPGNSQASVISNVSGHTSVADALNVDESFSQEFDPLIESGPETNDSDKIPHVTVVAEQESGEFHYYSFTVANAGDTGIFDTDWAEWNEIDTELVLLDTDGSTKLDSNNDSPFSGPGDTWAPTWNSFLTYTFADPGVYYIRVGEGGDRPFSSGGEYTLHISIASVSQSPTFSLYLDIKPQSCPNPLNTKSKGVLPVAILGTEDLDVNDIDTESILLEGVAPLRWNVEDVSTPLGDSQEGCECTEEGGDGFDDLTLKFDTQEIVSMLGDLDDGDEMVLTLTGELIDGSFIEGADCIIVLEKRGGKPK